MRTKITTPDASGRDLIWLVAYCEGKTNFEDPAFFIRNPDYDPTTNWAQGGPIIERERIAIEPQIRDLWTTKKAWEGDDSCTTYGSGALIAAMRAHIVAKLGNTSYIPD
jgi:hypothetical protein